MANKECRLRKYRRKKLRAKTSERFTRWSRLYWRYHLQVYGPTILLWKGDDND